MEKEKGFLFVRDYKDWEKKARENWKIQVNVDLFDPMSFHIRIKRLMDEMMHKAALSHMDNHKAVQTIIPLGVFGMYRRLLCAVV